MARLEAKKARIAMRVIEVFEYFGTGRHPATVMDIARHYGRPQSSTSELLSTLVEMGLVYKNAATREFMPTPRLATLGLSAQSPFIQDGRLFNYMDVLAKTTRRTVALFGMIGTHIQIFRWLAAAPCSTATVGSGDAELLTSSAAGQLLLATLDAARVKGLLWRLNAEAPGHEKFDLAEMIERIGRYRSDGYATGRAGFVPDAQMSTVLLPHAEGEPPLALGILYDEESARDAEAYVATLKYGIGQIFHPDDSRLSRITTPFMRAI